ncbi:MAG: hypothetical protein EZS28_024716 [Streblomastix strix]|uniref:Uncharacterized protein n=1 Tax=Streblomastix strix TaxID=222440 RepID=A0A5J4VBE3_9EUKA|nr:MAG: hypothetical protein EZS28_024716 [Streblomastix strix]
MIEDIRKLDYITFLEDNFEDSDALMLIEPMLQAPFRRQETVTYSTNRIREITYSTVYPRTKADMEKFIQYLSALIIENQERTPDDTHTRFVAIVSIVAVVYRIPLTG